jgi:excisionase family DNA binding protein
MTVKEAAKKLCVDESTVRRLCRSGEIRGERRGRDWWIEPAALKGVKPRGVGRPPVYSSKAKAS